MVKKNITVLLIFLITSFSAFSQLDSLKKVWASAAGRKRIELSLQIGSMLARDKPDTAIQIAQEALKNISDTTLQYNAYELLGSAYLTQDNYPEALSNYLKAFHIAELLQNREYKASLLGNISYIYYNQKNIEQALDYMQKALAVNKELKISKKVAANLSNIGVLYEKLGEYDKALDYYNQALELSTALKNQATIANINTNMGNVYLRQSIFKPAESHHQTALEIYRSMGNKNGMTTAWCNLSQLYLNSKRREEAIRAADSSIRIAESVGALKDRRESYAVLYEAYKQQNNFSEALKAYEKHIVFKDSMFNVEKEKVLAEMESKFESKLKSQEIKQLKTEQALHKTIIYWSVASAVLFCAALVLVFITFSLRNKLLHKKNQELVIKHEAEQKIAQLENEKLQLGIEYKTRQVVSSAMLIAQKNEVLQELVEKVKRIDQRDQEKAGKELKALAREINSNLELTDDWEHIKLHFEQVHPKFFDNLLMLYPSLTVHEQKLCAYFRMKMNSKEISRLLNITPESVKKLRYRLRKKMMLQEEDNMQEALQQI